MSPRRLGQQRSPFNYFEDTLEIEPTAHLSGSLLMPQATEKARNGRDHWPAAHGLATTHDDDRASIASRCSGPASNMSLASYPATA
jgi:hypothetical protein